MFYSQSLLSRKGPLGNIWIAVYCFKKLKREQIAATDITSSIDKIMPEVQISYRLLAQLLLGIVRIFSKKVDYLYHDCNEALTNIRRACISSQHDLPKKENVGPHDNVIVAKEITHAPKHKHPSSKKRSPEIEMEVMRRAYNDVTITLPEHFELDAFDLGVSDVGCATESTKHSEEFILEEELATERNPDPANEYQHRETDIHIDYSCACLTPIDDMFYDDIIPPYLMEVDVQNSQYIKSGSLAEAEEQKAQEDSQHTDELENHGSLRVSFSEGLHSQNEQSHNQANQAHEVKVQEEVPSNCKYPKSSNLAEEQGMKVQENSQHTDELENNGSLGAIISEGISSQNKLSDNQAHQVKFQEKMPSNVPEKVQEPKIQVEVTNLRSRKAIGIEESHEKSKVSGDSGLPSPKFAVATPVKRETSRISRKRKRNLYDEIIVLPNEILRMWIHDASGLVCKRRKAPHTLLDAWKVRRIMNLQERFTEPLIPYNSSEIIASPLKKFKSSVDSAPLKNDVPNIVSDADNVPPEKPITNTMTQTDDSEVLKADTSYDEERVKEPGSVERLNSGLNIMDQDICSAGNDGDIQADVWSTRTRALARYLCHRFLDLDGQKRNKIRSLERILDGQMRSKCARIFYETLTLKSHDFIDVKQERAYDDIIISVTPKLEAVFMDQ